MRLWLLAILLLAGCGDKAAPATDVEPTAATGSLHGIIIDVAFVPIDGVQVQLEGGPGAISGADGAWQINDLEPGTYFVTASKNGMQPSQVSATVIAGNAVEVLFKLNFNATIEAYAVKSEWKGFIDCSLRAGTGGTGGSVGINACNELGNQGLTQQNVNRPHEFAEGMPQFFQHEIVWQATQTGGTDLALMVGPPECTDPKYVWKSGPSPLFFNLDSYELNARGVSPDFGLCSRVFASTSGELQHLAGLQFQQEFVGYGHAFYNFEPTDGWLFSVDGNPI